jgi:hypothetical protein
MSEANRHSTPFAFDLIDLDQHPDGKLLRLCAKMTNLQDRWDIPLSCLDQALTEEYWETANELLKLHPRTRGGFQMKALVAKGMLSQCQQRLRKMTDGNLSMWGAAVSIVNDVIQGMPARAPVSRLGPSLTRLCRPHCLRLQRRKKQPAARRCGCCRRPPAGYGSATSPMLSYSPSRRSTVAAHWSSTSPRSAGDMGDAELQFETTVSGD